MGWGIERIGRGLTTAKHHGKVGDGMPRRVKKLLTDLGKKVHRKGCVSLLPLLEYSPNARLLDVGCGDGLFTKQLAERIGTKDITGIDIDDWNVPFGFVRGYIEEGLPFEDGFFDVVVASHIIEHLSNTDFFTRELYRVLRKGGYVVIATPNLSSAGVIVLLLLNRQPPSLDVSDHFRIWGDLSWKGDREHPLHRRLFTMEGLAGLLTFYGFKVDYKVWAGYGFYLLDKLLGGHAATLIIKARKV